jgi:N-acetylglutamate synthase-like GNAT family acetyltransferase
MIPRKINCALDYKKLQQHFLEDIVGNDRRLRFGAVVSNQYILDYIEHPKFTDMWFVVEDKERIVATCHVAYDKEHNVAELGLTVSADYRNQKLGQQLFDRGVTWARMMGAESIFMHCLTENHIMQQIARKSGMTVVTFYSADESEASIKVDKSRFSAGFEDVVMENMALYDQAIRNQQWFFTKFLKRIMGR